MSSDQNDQLTDKTEIVLNEETNNSITFGEGIDNQYTVQIVNITTHNKKDVQASNENNKKDNQTSNEINQIRSFLKQKYFPTQINGDQKLDFKKLTTLN